MRPDTAHKRRPLGISGHYPVIQKVNFLKLEKHRFHSKILVRAHILLMQQFKHIVTTSFTCHLQGPLSCSCSSLLQGLTLHCYSVQWLPFYNVLLSQGLDQEHYPKRLTIRVDHFFSYYKILYEKIWAKERKEKEMRISNNIFTHIINVDIAVTNILLNKETATDVPCGIMAEVGLPFVSVQYCFLYLL